MNTLELIEEHLRSARSNDAVRRAGPVLEIAPSNEVLVPSSVSVAEKCRRALRHGRAATIGIDLVNRGVDELLCRGALPRFMSARFAAGELAPEIVESVVSGIARAARANSIELGECELARLPGPCLGGECELSATMMGRAPREQLLDRSRGDGSRVAAGDLLVGVGALGLHSSGVELACAFCLDEQKLALEAKLFDDETTLRCALFAPHKNYLGVLCEPLKRAWPNALVHVTEDGLIGSLQRALGREFDAELELGAWPELPIARWIRRRAGWADERALRSFNGGLGLVAIVSPKHTVEFAHWLSLWNEPSWIVGRIGAGTGRVALSGSLD